MSSSTLLAAPLRRSLRASLYRALSSPLAARLTYPHGVDRYAEWFSPAFSLSEVRAEVVAIDHPTADSVTLKLKPNRNWQGFRAGQYVRLTVEIDGRRRMRCYSPANAEWTPDGLIELTAKATPSGFVSKFLKQGLTTGTIVGLSQAEGSFALPVERPGHILLISGGSGITPVMAMLRTLVEEGHAGPITFLHYANRAADQVYGDELAAIAATHGNVTVLRGYATADEGGELSGLFCREHLAGHVPGFADAETFLCGPPGLMKAVQALWTAEGLADRLHVEHFTAAAPVVVDSGSAVGDVRFVRSERLVTNNGATLLDQAERAGLKPESGCRMGICHACTCRKVSGRVRDTRTGEISDAGEADIQICVSVPVGTVTLDL